MPKPNKPTKEIIDIFSGCLQNNDDLEWRLTNAKYRISDVYIRKKSDTQERWLRLQLKYSDKTNYHINSRTENFLVVCFTTTNDIWVIPKDECQNINNIKISQKENTKYVPYKTVKSDLVSKIKTYLDNTNIEPINIYEKYESEHALDFNVISNIISNDGCELLTTESHYIRNGFTSRSKLSIKMSCGHKMDCSLSCFQRQIHHKCKPCINKKRKEPAYNNEFRVASGAYMESNAFTLIENILKNKFHVMKSHEGCLADMIIKPLDVTDNKWVGIQIKSKTKGKSNYAFSKVGKYPGLIVLCVSFPDEKLWMFDGDTLLSKTCLSIGFTNSKYKTNEVTKDQLPDALLAKYDGFKKSNIETLMMPLSNSTRLEHENRLYRESILGDLTFEYPRIDGTKYDVIINGYKVQDKCARERDNKYLYVRFQNNYIKGDNDYYWISLPDKSFYIIPENILFDKSKMKIKGYLRLEPSFDQFKYNSLQTPEELNKIKSLF